MGQNSKIEWTHHTANLWWGCTEVHAGCDNCYARVFSERLGKKLWGNDQPRWYIKSVWDDLDKYQKIASEAGEIHRVFVGSMMDIFEKSMLMVDSKNIHISMLTDWVRLHLFSNITKKMYPNLLFLLLTKRPSNINKMIPEAWKENPPDNVWFGTSPVDQKTANTLIPQLLEVNGKRFLSIEPQLGHVSLTNVIHGGYNFNCLNGMGYWETSEGIGAVGKNQIIHWVIQGGESGHHRRPFDLDWAYSMKGQCIVNEVPYFFKQIDKVIPIPEDLLIRQFPVI